MDEEFEKLLCELNRVRSEKLQAGRRVMEVSGSLGRVLRRMREDIGFSLAEMAAAVGVSKGYIGYVETGKREVSGDLAKKIREIWRKRGMAVGLK